VHPESLEHRLGAFSFGWSSLGVEMAAAIEIDVSAARARLVPLATRRARLLRGLLTAAQVRLKGLRLGG